jgi:hypothetical protein
LATICNSACITVVGVDAAYNSTINGDYVVKYEVASTAVVAAVTTAARNFAIVVGIKVLH